MAMSDPIADLLTRIRNAIEARHEQVVCPSSKMKVRMAEVMKAQGYIRDYVEEQRGAQRVLRIYLKYLPDRQNAITGLRRISKPGRRIYVKHDEIPQVLNGLGIGILSTSRGILTDKDARKARVGGELLCTVW